MDTTDTMPFFDELCPFICMLTQIRGFLSPLLDEDDCDSTYLKHSILNKEDPSGVTGELLNGNKKIEEEEHTGKEDKKVFF